MSDTDLFPTIPHTPEPVSCIELAARPVRIPLKVALPFETVDMA